MRLQSILISAVLAILPRASAQAYYNQPLPIPCEGSACVNPPATEHSSLPFQDTSVIRRDDGTYFRFSKGNDTGLGLNVVTAPSLRGPWTYSHTILGDALKSPCGAADGHASSWRWAPEAHFINGQYYMYYTVEHPDGANTCFDQCVATSPNMDPGSWTDHGSMDIPVPPLELSSDGSYRPPYVRLDGNLLVDSFDPQGTSMVKYMVFGSYQFGLYGVALSDDLLTMKPGSVPYLVIADQYQRPSEPGQFDQSGNYTEGPYQLAHGDWLYIFYSRGNCCAPGSFDISTVYQTQVCRTPIGNGPAGPYVDRNGESCARGSYYRHGSIFLYSNNEDGNQATVFAPGSVGVINDPDEGLCMWYQYQDNTAELPNLRFGYNYLNFDADGWPILTAER